MWSRFSRTNQTGVKAELSRLDIRFTLHPVYDVAQG